MSDSIREYKVRKKMVGFDAFIPVITTTNGTDIELVPVYNATKRNRKILYYKFVESKTKIVIIEPVHSKWKFMGENQHFKFDGYKWEDRNGNYVLRIDYEKSVAILTKFGR